MATTSTTQPTSYRIGDVVEVSMGRYSRFIKVSAIHEDVKNGEAGIDGRLVIDGVVQLGEFDTVWAYDSQVVSISRSARIAR